MTLQTRLVAAGLVLAAVVGLGWYVVHLRDSRDAWKLSASVYKAQADGWERQAGLTTTIAAIGERRASNTAHTVTLADEASHDVQTAPDVDGALAAYDVGLGRVRASGYASLTSPDAGVDAVGQDAGH